MKGDNKMDSIVLKNKYWKKNRGFYLESAGEVFGLWERLPDRPHHLAGDVRLESGSHAQVKLGNGGQLEGLTSLSDVRQRIHNEYSDIFILGFKKGKRIELFFFLKENFITLLESDGAIKIERKSPSNGGGLHARLTLGLSKKWIMKLKSLSYESQALPVEFW